MNALQQLIALQGDLLFFLPELTLCLCLIVLILGGFFPKIKTHQALPIFSIIGLSFSLFFDYLQLNLHHEGFLFNDMLYINHKNIFFKYIFEGCGIFTVLFCLISPQIKTLKQHYSEIFSLIVFVILSSHLLLMSANFLMLFLSLEMISIGSYILVSIKSSKQTSEAALKYILMGMVSSGIMLYGISFLFGFTGTLDFTTTIFHQKLSLIEPAPVLMAFILLFAGVIFKISAVPFHFWSPDVYEAAPTPIVAFFSTVTKSAGLGLMLNVVPILWNYDFLTDATGLHDELLIGSLAFLTILIGTFGAMVQKNAKRLLAYSSIDQSGFMILPLISNNPSNTGIVVFYLIVYVISTFLVFICIDALEEITNSNLIESYNGIGKNNMVFSVIILFGLINLTGLPPTSGFLSKLFIFTEVWNHFTSKEHFYTLILLVLGLLTTILSLFFYIKIPYHLIFKSNELKKEPLISKKVYVILLILTAILIFTFTHSSLFIIQ